MRGCFWSSFLQKALLQKLHLFIIKQRFYNKQTIMTLKYVPPHLRKQCDSEFFENKINHNVAAMIANYLSLVNICSIRLVNKYFAEIFGPNNNYLWQQLLYRFFNRPNQKKKRKIWDQNFSTNPFEYFKIRSMNIYRHGGWCRLKIEAQAQKRAQDQAKRKALAKEQTRVQAQVIERTYCTELEAKKQDKALKRYLRRKVA